MFCIINSFSFHVFAEINAFEFVVKKEQQLLKGIVSFGFYMKAHNFG